MDGALVPEFLLERNPDADVLNVSGEVDLASSPELQALIETTLPGTRLIVDLTQCTYLDSSTLSVLVRAFKARGPALCIVVPADARIRRLFDELHDRRFGHQAVNEPVEIVNLRLTVTGHRDRAQFPGLASTGSNALIAHQPVVFTDAAHPVDAPIYDREKLGPGATVSGPAVVWEYASTTVLFAGDELRVAESGELIVRIGAS